MQQLYGMLQLSRGQIKWAGDRPACGLPAVWSSGGIRSRACPGRGQEAQWHSASVATPRECKPPHCAGNKRRGRPSKGQDTAPPAKRQRGRLTASATPSPAPDPVAAREARLKSLKDQRHRAYTQLQDARQQVAPCVHLCWHCGDKLRQSASLSCSRLALGLELSPGGAHMQVLRWLLLATRRQVPGIRCTAAEETASCGLTTNKSLIRTGLDT